VIRITSEQGVPLRAFPDANDTQVVEFHDRYGFVTEKSLQQRQKLRRAAGAFVPEHEARFQFELKFQNGTVNLQALRDCKLQKDGARYKLDTASGIYFIESAAPATAATVASLQLPKERSTRRLTILLGILLLSLVGLVLEYMPKTQEEEKKAEVLETLPVVIKPPPPVKAEVKDRIPPDPKLKAKKVLAKQLGFLGLLGRKDFKKAVGGLPTPTAQKSAGVGPGGTEGSGGELVAGMGRGLHQTTLGNTGLSGLGGIGTKGAGGGLGGYGDTAFGGVGSGTLSAIPLANDAKVDEGLDKSQIQATIMRYLSQVRACYEDGLKRNQALIGQVTMNFEINGGGNLNFSRVGRSSLNDRPVEDCISMKMMNWKFPQPRGGVNVKVSYPFMLRPVKS
jgi:hypothetical protein